MKIKPIVHALLALIGLLFFVSSLEAQVPEQERRALIDFYNSTNGKNWLEEKQWEQGTLTSGDLSRLEGIILSDDGKHVVGISLSAAGLTGTLPHNFFARLPELRLFAIDQNKIGGVLPEDLSNAVKLEGLYLSSTDFGGKLPSLDKLTGLRILGLDFMLRQEEQPLPNLLCFPELVFFDAYMSNKIGEIPQGIGALKKLRQFDVGANKLTGSLPASLNECTELRTLSVMNNRLEGEIPDLGKLVNLGPPELGGMGRLYLSDNQFTGSFPAWIVNCSQLDRFSISNNRLSGSLPEDFSKMKGLRAFYISQNQFTGSLPKKFASEVEELDFAGNEFTGAVPAEWRTLPNLWKATLGYNRLSGYCPPLYKTESGAMSKSFETMEVYMNEFSFADFKDWPKFAKSQDVKFRFSLQRPYKEKSRVDLVAGATGSLDADYPGELIGDESYRWFDLNLGEPVAGGTTAKLTIKNASAAHAHRYICFISTQKFGSAPTPAVQSSFQSEAAADKEPDIANLPPTLQSGFFDVYVDGQSIAGVSATGSSTPPRIYPTEVAPGAVLHLSGTDVVNDIRIFGIDGSRVATYTAAEFDRVTAPLTCGTYVVMLSQSGGGYLHSLLIVR